MERSLDELMRRYKEEIMRYAGRQASTSTPLNSRTQNVTAPNMTNQENFIGLTMPATERNTASIEGSRVNMPYSTSPGYRAPQQNNNISGTSPRVMQQRNMQSQVLGQLNSMPNTPNSATPPTQNGNRELTMLPALNGNTDTGFLIVQVSALQGAVPIINADVVVTREIGNETYLMWYDVTDESGKTRKFELPAPPREMSEQPSNGGIPYSTYNIRVSAPGFYTITNEGAQVFGGQTSIASIDMVPKRESQTDMQENITYNTPPSQLLNT